ncbi:MAG: gliding motility protein GldM, partial [Prevotella sp.]|nr:gliding motility protein GldM [Prevotella sp.]
TMQPEIYINGTRVNTTNGRYSFSAGGVGEHQFSGYLITRNAAGEELRRDFTQKYSVIPTPDGATVAADLMNVLYAGFKNPISVSVPGIPANQVTVSMSGGSLTPTGNGHYIAVPSAVGKDVSFNISVNDHGKTRSLTPFTFHVRKLPDPTPYMIVGDNRFRGGRLAKASLMGASGIKAAIDDGLLDIEFRVTGFEAVFFDNMGNAVPMVGNGSQFSERQKDAFRKLSRNRRFYISRVTAVGPDGISRQLNASMEIIVN